MQPVDLATDIIRYAGIAEIESTGTGVLLHRMPGWARPTQRPVPRPPGDHAARRAARVRPTATVRAIECHVTHILAPALMVARRSL